MTSQDVVVKRTVPVRVAELTAVAAEPGPHSVGPIFAQLIPQLLAGLAELGIRPGISVGHYEENQDDGSLRVHVGFDIADQTVVDDAITVVDLPVVLVASLTHRGPLDTLTESYRQLAQWIAASDHRAAGASRELYHRFDDDDPGVNVTELQIVLVE